MRLASRPFLVVAGCTSMAWMVAISVREGASVSDLVASALNLLGNVAAVWLGATAVGRSRAGTWGADRTPAWMHAAVTLVAAALAESGDYVLNVVGVPIGIDGGPPAHEFLQAVALAAALWAAYLLALRAWDPLGATGSVTTRANAWASPVLESASAAPVTAPLAPSSAIQRQASEPVPQTGLLRLVRDRGVIDTLEVLKAEGNYVDVLGREAHELVLYRFHQAVDELGSFGLQVHRSYWVRRTAVRDMQRSGKTGRLTLASGREVPVSAPYLAAAQALLLNGRPGEEA